MPTWNNDRALVDAHSSKTPSKSGRTYERDTPGHREQPTGPGAGNDRRHLHNYRVIQRNLMYVIGLPIHAGNEDTLRRSEYFGQYGKVSKIVIHKSQNSNHTSVT